MLYLACILLGIIAARWLATPLAALLRVVVFVVSIAIAARITTALVPLEINLRGFSAGAGVGLLFVSTLGGVWFFILGWRGRVAATEADDIERARQKAIKDRQVG